MRKILEKENVKRKQAIKLAWGFFLILIMIFSIVGFSFLSSIQTGDTTQTIEYNGREFTRTQYGTWSFNYGGNEYQTKYSPLETQNVSVDITKTLSEYQGGVLYFVGGSQDAMNEILVNIGRFASRQNLACLDEDNCEGDYPIKSCQTENIIIFMESNKTLVTQEQKCIYIQSSIENYTKVSDAFIFGLFEI